MCLLIISDYVNVARNSVQPSLFRSPITPAVLANRQSCTFWIYIRDALGREGHRDYFSRSLMH